jgi:hypothetical protein
MQVKDDRPLSARIRRTALAAVFLLGIVFTVVSCAGCSDNSQKSNTPVASVPSPEGSKDLIGVWAQTSGKGTRYYPDLQLHFDKNGIVTLGDATRKDEWIANYRVEGRSLIFSDKDGNTLRYDIGQLSESELLLGNHTLHYVGGLSVLQGAYTFLEGRWEHVSDDQEESGLIAEGKARVKRFEKKRAALQALLDKALGDREELVAKLREAGVKKPADLKGNSRGQQLAAALQRLTVEIDGLERSISAIDQAIVEAQSVVRRLERERAGIGDEEMRKLAEQLREVEERTDGAARTPVTPLDVEAALDKALKGSRSSKPSQPSTALGDKRLVGKWEIVEGEQKGTATFTEGGTVFFAWFRRDLKRNLTETGNYTLAGKSLKIKASGQYDGESVREIEFLSDDELLVHRPKGFNFTWLYGRLKRAK